ncbi:helix-turn-helix domain-containing protein [Chryseobacterium sp. CBSDS_008]|uniref:helix-turn-helix domain-containing protein n=1 Tax=Chryseobacterium sp. CBSDS_008 TaxID=3415265 RepID=UPI003CED18DC
MKEPNYRKIFEDILEIKFPNKKEVCLKILKKNKLSHLDIIKLNNLIFEAEHNSFSVNQRYKAYNSETIIEILNYQSKKGLNNSEVAAHFNLSKNTITKWKKYYKIRKSIK